MHVPTKPPERASWCDAVFCGARLGLSADVIVVIVCRRPLKPWTRISPFARKRGKPKGTVHDFVENGCPVGPDKFVNIGIQDGARTPQKS